MTIWIWQLLLDIVESGGISLQYCLFSFQSRTPEGLDNGIDRDGSSVALKNSIYVNSNSQEFTYTRKESRL